jgi:SEC-C motif
VGRNDPCPCGSGKKYKKCCLDRDIEAGRTASAALPEAMAQFAEQAARHEHTARVLREQYGIYISFVAPAQYQGQKVWAIGSRLYPNRPPKETFSEFIISVLGGTLGEQWIAEQESHQEDGRHFVRRAYSKAMEWTRTMEVQEDGLLAGAPNGWMQYLVSLAFDVVSLIQAAEVPESLVQRLRTHDQYQGARYEVAVAAIFARLGCRIEFIVDEEHPEKHPEFIAVHPEMGVRVAVEAKSRHRPGVIHRPGDHDDAEAQRGDVQRLYKRAIEKAPADGTPFMIFLDVNAPPTPDVPAFEKQWQRDIREWLPAADPDDKEYLALCVTNYSPHYAGDNVGVSGEFVFIESRFVREQLPEEFRTMLLTALNTYGRVPEITESGDIRE